MFLAKALLVSILATALLGPTQPIPASSSASTRPASSGFSGPTTARLIDRFFIVFNTPETSVGDCSKYRSDNCSIWGLMVGAIQ